MSEKLCIFCRNFRWTAEEISGMGSTLTGPMMEGGDATCAAGEYKDWPRPDDEDDWRALILRGQNCANYNPVNTPAPGGASTPVTGD